MIANVPALSESGFVARMEAGFLANPPTAWYALRVKSRFEFVTSAALRQKGFEQFLPSYRSGRRWSDRIKDLEMPLFPGYVFCRFDLSDLYRALNTAGVLHVVSAGRIPLPMNDEEILAVQALCRSRLQIEPWPLPLVGQRVMIIRGPLAVMEGQVVEFKNKCRIVVSISLLQRSVAAEIDRDWVRPIS